MGIQHGQDGHHGQGDEIHITPAQLHELRNRLTVVKGLTQLLLRHVNRGETPMLGVVQRAEAILAEINTLDAAITNLRYSEQTRDTASGSGQRRN